MNRFILLLTLLGLFGVGSPLNGQTKFVDQLQQWIDLRIETRFDYQRAYAGGTKMKDETGFKGKYLNVMLDGKIGEHFSYSYKQRLNKGHEHKDFFDATDRLALTYCPDEHWSFSAGKEVMLVGGYEYDASPIDIYFPSEFWHQFSCFQLGATIGYDFNQGRDALKFQVTQSAFRHADDELYAYNLFWSGQHGIFSTLYSANLIEYRPGDFINYLALGHRVEAKRWAVEFDFINRATSSHTFFFRDCSLVTDVAFSPFEKLNLFAHASYDVNRTDVAADSCVYPDTEITVVGGGVEFFPLKKRDLLRVHAVYSYSWGTNGNPEGVNTDKQHWCGVGLTWSMQFFNK